MTQPERIPSTTYAGLAADDVGTSDERAPIVFLAWSDVRPDDVAAHAGRARNARSGKARDRLDLPGHRWVSGRLVLCARGDGRARPHGDRRCDLRDPILVGHSASASVAAVYATRHSTTGIVLVEGTFLVAPFAEMLRSLEPVLRGPGFGAAWSRISEYAFRLDEVARGCPVIRRGDEPATTGCRPRLLAGPLRANARRAAGLAGPGSGQDAADRPAGHVGRRARSERRRGSLAGGEPARRSNARLARQRSLSASGAPACLRGAPGSDGSPRRPAGGVDESMTSP